jgi:hypothetical protein
MHVFDALWSAKQAVDLAKSKAEALKSDGREDLSDPVYHQVLAELADAKLRLKEAESAYDASLVASLFCNDQRHTP